MNTSSIIIIGLGLITLITLFYRSYRKMKNMPLVADSEKIISLNDKNFQQQISKGVMLVDFWASWCAPCKMLAPILNETSDELNGHARIGKLNVEQFQAISAKYGVRSIPTMILFKNGKEVKRFVGVKQKDFLLKEISKA